MESPEPTGPDSTTLTASDDYKREHGTFEVGLYLTDGDSRPANLTIGVVADKDALTDIDEDLYHALETGEAPDVGMDNAEAKRLFSDTLQDMLDGGLLTTASCRSFDVHSVTQLNEAIESGELETYRLV